MPIYEYECACGNKEEKFFHISEIQDKLKCKKCGSEMKKVVSMTSFTLKGSGWYKDGYSDSSSKKGSDKGTPR